MSETSRPSIITVGRGKKSHFDNHEQDKQFFRCVASPQAGIRISEAMGLKWEDVDYQNKQIDLRRVWVKDTMMRALQPGS
jgi:integrase